MTVVQSTVIEWLVKLKKAFIRINTDDERTLFEYFRCRQ